MPAAVCYTSSAVFSRSSAPSWNGSLGTLSPSSFSALLVGIASDITSIQTTKRYGSADDETPSYHAGAFWLAFAATLTPFYNAEASFLPGGANEEAGIAQFYSSFGTSLIIPNCVCPA
jgi:hypothetical protein